MFLDEILESLKKNELPKSLRLHPETEANYRRALGENPTFFTSSEANDTFTSEGLGYSSEALNREMLADHREFFRRSADYAKIIESVRLEYTYAPHAGNACMRLPEANVILLSKHLLVLLWELTKITLLFRHEREDLAYLKYANQLLYFYTNHRPRNGKSFARPPIYAYPDSETFELLRFLYEIQERFVVGHEIAHLLGGRKRDGASPPVYDDEFLARFIEENLSILQTRLPEAALSDPLKIRLAGEIRADQQAIDAVVEAMGTGRDSASVSFSLLLLFVFFMWYSYIDMQLGKGPEEFLFWYIRGAFFQNSVKISEYEELRERLESTYVIAAVQAARTLSSM